MVMKPISMFAPTQLEVQLGGIVEKRRHINLLQEVEEYILSVSPLHISYDVSRTQPWYYSEFSYTEFCGGIVINPQSDELAVRTRAKALENGTPKKVDATQFILERIASANTGDKYILNSVVSTAKKVAFLPGSNIFLEMVSKELLSRAMFENPDMIIKPHPLTHEQMLRMLKAEYGAHRVLDPKDSAWDVLKNAEEVYTVHNSELSAYAILLGKKTHDITNFLNARGASYFPVMWDVLGKEPEFAKQHLINKFNTFEAGLIFPQDPDWKQQVDAYFKLAMEVREQFKPMVWNSFKPVICKNSVPKDVPSPQ